MLKNVVTTILILFICRSQQAKKSAKNVCDRKSENQMDVALARLLVFGQKDVRFPETVKEFRPFCNEAKRMLDRINRYSNTCLNKFGKDSASVMLHSMTAELRSVCKAGRLNKRAYSLMEAASCGNEGNSIFYKNCYVKLIDKFMGALNGDIKMRIPISCCSFFEFLRCWESEAEKVAKCTPKVRDFFIKWLSKMFEGITQLMCNVYDESNSQCDTIIKESPNRSSKQKRYNSVLLPLINIGMSLGDDQSPKKP